ncbi:hypothetical protein TorRG33x02_305510 [Trema orientale]|uniref:DUF1985 domain-containing protein n=1 Tax=Trema orientale TaxID=63057 RepID=A0A2P5BX95_TREOI|nr:hypothetical protein TorRG33x02_305510 [Trema orientale]
MPLPIPVTADTRFDIPHTTTPHTSPEIPHFRKPKPHFPLKSEPQPPFSLYFSVKSEEHPNLKLDFGLKVEEKPNPILHFTVKNLIQSSIKTAKTRSAEGGKSSSKAQATTSALRKRALSKSSAKSPVVERKNSVEKMADLKGKVILEASVEKPKVYYEDSSSDDEVINIDVCGIMVPFTKVHLVVISGLKIHGDTNVHVVKLGDNIRDKYFSSHKVVKRETLDIVYSSIQTESDEDAMKPVLLYFLAQAVLSNVKSMNVPNMCFRLVNDLDAFNAYPWGSYLWSDLKDQMKKRAIFRSVTTINGKLVTRYELNRFPVVL